QYGGRGDSAAFPQEGVPAMSSATTPVPGTGPQPVAAAAPIPSQRRPRARGRLSLLAHGLPMVWMNGGALAVCLAMILGLLALVLYQGFGTFWPVPSLQVRTIDGKVYLGEVVRDSTYRPEPGVFDTLPEGKRDEARSRVEQQKGLSQRRLIRTANYDLVQSHH